MLQVKTMQKVLSSLAAEDLDEYPSFLISPPIKELIEKAKDIKSVLKEALSSAVRNHENLTFLEANRIVLMHCEYSQILKQVCLLMWREQECLEAIFLKQDVDNSKSNNYDS